MRREGQERERMREGVERGEGENRERGGEKDRRGREWRGEKDRRGRERGGERILWYDILFRIMNLE